MHLLSVARFFSNPIGGVFPNITSAIPGKNSTIKVRMCPRKICGFILATASLTNHATLSLNLAVFSRLARVKGNVDVKTCLTTSCYSRKWNLKRKSHFQSNYSQHLNNANNVHRFVFSEWHEQRWSQFEGYRCVNLNHSHATSRPQWKVPSRWPGKWHINDLQKYYNAMHLKLELVVSSKFNSNNSRFLGFEIEQKQFSAYLHVTPPRFWEQFCNICCEGWIHTTWSGLLFHAHSSIQHFL